MDVVGFPWLAPLLYAAWAALETQILFAAGSWREGSMVVVELAVGGGLLASVRFEKARCLACCCCCCM